MANLVADLKGETVPSLPSDPSTMPSANDAHYTVSSEVAANAQLQALDAPDK